MTTDKVRPAKRQKRRVYAFQASDEERCIVDKELQRLGHTPSEFLRLVTGHWFATPKAKRPTGVARKPFSV